MEKISKGQMGANTIIFVLLILKKGDSYGYNIAKKIKEVSQGRTNSEAGSLYPVLKNMEKQKLIESSWNVKDYHKPRKYYKIQKQGLVELERLMEEALLVQKMIKELS